MKELLSVAPVLAATLVVPLVLRLLGTHPNKLLTDKEKQAFAKAKFPKGIHRWKYVVLGLVFFGLALSLAAGLMIFLPQFTPGLANPLRHLVAPGSIVYNASVGGGILALLVMTVTFFGWLVLIGYIVLLFPKIVQIYLTTSRESCDFALKIYVGILVISLPFFFFAMHAYKAIDASSVTLNSFFSVQDNRIPLSKVALMSVECKIAANSKGVAYPSLLMTIVTDDGKSYDFISAADNDGFQGRIIPLDSVHELYSSLSRHGIGIFVNLNPCQGYIQQHGTPKQQELYTAYNRL